MLRVRLFGEGSVDTGDGPRPVDALPKALPLLAYLLIERERPIPRDRMAFDLWPDHDEESALANLRRHLFRLRKMLPVLPSGASWVIATRKIVRWNGALPAWLDIEEFERLGAADATVHEALDLYRDDVLAAVDEPWIVAERERLRALHLAYLHRAFDVAHRRHDLVSSARFAQNILRDCPDDEAAVRRLVAIRYEAGDRAGALAEFERFAAALFEELGEMPMPETTALIDRIAAGGAVEAAHPPAPTPEPDSGRFASGLPFVGRAAELDTVTAAWRSAQDGRGSVVFVTGEAGIGKSRFVDVFAQRCVHEGGSIFLGRAAPVEAQPYEVVAHALRSALPVILDRTTDALWLGVLAAIVPELCARRPEIVRPPALDDRSERSRLFEAIARAIGDAAAVRPRVVVLEDVHWASNATFEAIADLAQRLASLRVIVMLTARDDLAPDHPFNRVRATLLRAGHGINVPLDLLSKSDIVTLLHERGETGGVAERATALHVRTEGHPLFLALSLDASESSETLVEAIDRKFATLGDDARTFADFAAIAGTRFELDLVRHISGWTDARAIDAVDELIDRRIVNGSATPYVAEYAFAHALFWSSAYERMPAGRRTHGHRRAARALAPLAATEPRLARELARHYEGSGQRDDAANAFVQAAQYAASIGANDEALSFATRALELSTQFRPALTARALRETLYARVGRRAEQRADLDLFHAEALSSGDTDLLCEAERRRAALAHALGERDAERTAIAALERAARQSGRARWQGEIALLHAHAEVARGDLDDAAMFASAAVDAFRLEDDADGMLRALTVAAEIASSRRDYLAAKARLDEAAEIAAHFVEPASLLRVLRSRAAAGFVARDFAAVADATRHALRVCEQIGDVESEAELVSRLAALAARRFDIGEARELYERARERYAVLDNPRALAGLTMNGAMVEFAIGNVALALDRLRNAAARFDALDDLRGKGLAHVNASLALSFLGRHDEAIADAQTGIAIARACHHPMIEAQALTNLGAAYRRSGDAASAYVTIRAALAIRRPGTSAVDLAEDLSDLALTCLDLQRIDEAVCAVDEYVPVIDELINESLFAQDLCYTAARVYAAASDERANRFGTLAQQVVEARVARLPADARGAFLGFGQNPAICRWRLDDSWTVNPLRSEHGA